MEEALKDAWEKGYMTLSNAVPSDIAKAVLDTVESLQYESIFKEVYDDEFDEKRMQAPFTKTSIRALRNLMSLVNNVIDEANMRLETKQWVVLKCLPGGVEQEAHRDFPSFETGRAPAKFNTIQAGAIVGLMPGTKVIVYESCFTEADPTKRKVVEFGAGDCVIFRSDRVHSDAPFDEMNYRVHCTLTVEGVEWTAG